MKPTYSQSIKPIPGSLKIVELFPTIQGEGVYIGVPSIFVRTGMCNLCCPGCDTVWSSWNEQTLDEVEAKVRSFKARHVVFSGGEPTLWQYELGKLAERLNDKTITVETNGAVPITDTGFLNWIDLFTFSPKVGSLGRDEKFSWNVVYANIEKTRGRNQIKYVLDPSNGQDVDRVFAFQAGVEGHIPDERVFFQPYDKGTLVNIYARQVAFNINEEYNKDLIALTKLVMERSGSRFRVVPQLHKYLSWR